MIIAQITDLHVQPSGEKAYGIVDTNQFLRAAVAQINQLQPQPDLVMATGDLIDGGTVAEYEMLQQLLQPLKAPLYLAMGNHDDRTTFRTVFPGLPYVPAAGFVQYVLDDYPLRLIVLDTLVPGQSYGEIDPERLAWLEARLAEAADRPTLIFMHHPPFTTGLQGMDKSTCRGSEALAAVIERYPCVQRVACGHLHRSIQTLWAGTLASIAPSVAHQVRLDLTPDNSPAFSLEPPAFHLHCWQPETQRLITHTVFLGDFPAYSYKTKAPVTL
jgi:Icc protein